MSEKLTTSTTTRKSLIIYNYQILEKELKLYFQEELFPSLDDIDVADLVFYITLLFSGVETKEDYKSKILELVDNRNVKINAEILNKIWTPIMIFVEWIKNL